MAREPYVTADVVDVNSRTIALTGNSSRLIRYMSHAKATMTATAYDGASINLDTRILRNGGDTGYTSPYTFYNVESEKFSFSVEDSNGLVGRYNLVADMIPYVKLTCHAGYEASTTGELTITCTGECYNGYFSGNYNTLEVYARYSKNGGSYSGWYPLTVSRSGNSYSGKLNIVNAGDYKTQYVIEVEANDLLMSCSSVVNGAAVAPIFHWSGEDFVFEVPVTFKQGFTGGSDSGGSSSGSSSGSSGGVSNAEDGLWTPTLYSGAIDSYTMRKGWYTKAGSVVTVGFYVKAECASGYYDTGIEISGLPFTPECSASGGGICSGAYVPSGYAFQCFVAENGLNIISTRVQRVNTSDGNLSTSAGGCSYRYGGGTLTLSGTITYMTADDDDDYIYIEG